MPKVKPVPNTLLDMKKKKWKPDPYFVASRIKDWRGKYVKREVVFGGQFIDLQKVELHYPKGGDGYGNTRWVCKYNGEWFKSVMPHLS